MFLELRMRHPVLVCEIWQKFRVHDAPMSIRAAITGLLKVNNVPVLDNVFVPLPLFLALVLIFGDTLAAAAPPTAPIVT